MTIDQSEGTFCIFAETSDGSRVSGSFCIVRDGEREKHLFTVTEDRIILNLDRYAIIPIEFFAQMGAKVFKQNIELAEMNVLFEGLTNEVQRLRKQIDSIRRGGESE